MQHRTDTRTGRVGSPLVSTLAAGQTALSLLAVIGVFLNPATPRWYRLVVVIALILTLVIGLSITAVPATSTLTKRFLQTVFEGRVRSRMVVTGLILLPILGTAAIVMAAGDVLPPLWSFFPFVLFWPLLTAWLLTTVTDSTKHHARSFSINLTVSAVSFILFAFLLEAALQLMFPRLPAAITSRMPQAALHTGIRYDTPYGVRQYPPHQQVDFVVDGRFGDIAVPYCTFPAGETAEPPYRVQYTRDAFGFRNPAEWPDKAALVVVGDSFVEAENVRIPFWEGITSTTIGLGIPGTGNTEQHLVLQEFGIARKPDVVVMAYYEGNDLLDNVRFEAAQQAGETIYDYTVRHTPRLQFLVTYQLLQWLIAPLRGDACPEPVIDSHGNAMTFHYAYLSILTVDKNALVTSQAFELTRQAILDAEALARSNGAVFVLAYIPVKAHVYWNDLAAAGEVSRMGKIASPLVMSRSLLYYNTGAPYEETARLLTENHDAQRQVIEELAEQSGILFLDFTPYFQAVAAEGEALYFYGDSHWNQRGHDLANRVLRVFLQAQGLMSGSLSG